MIAEILDGARLSRSIRQNLPPRLSHFQETHKRSPGLAVILVGDDPASAVYVKHKIADCKEVGIRSTLIRLPQETSQSTLLEHIEQLNADPAIDGLLVQLPLPLHIDKTAIIQAISPSKDVDGFHLTNVGALTAGHPRLVPCTPAGVMRLLEQTRLPLNGLEAVVVGRSNIVGKPQALLLLQAGATVTVCHHQTRDLSSHTRRADLLVVAVGRARLITGDMVKSGAIVVDVGMNRLPDGTLVGDVDFASTRTVASWITPVPGGVGPMTRAMLLLNTLQAASWRATERDHLVPE